MLKGEKLVDLPAVQKIRAARQPQDRQALGLEIPPAFLIRADKIIE